MNLAETILCWQGNWLDAPVRCIESDNYDERPDYSEPEAVIIHAISLPPTAYGGDYVEALFTNRLDSSGHPYFKDIESLKVSAHFYIRRSGLLTQFVAVDKRAWHAGVSECLGRDCVNDFSIGIELEGCDHESFTLAQYDNLALLVRTFRSRWPWLGPDRLFGHSDIAPGRKTDPGPYFDWQRLLASIPC